MEKPIRISRHGEIRMQQRGISMHALLKCIKWGQQFPAGKGCIAYFLGEKAIRYALEFGINLRNFKNIAVIMSNDGVVITVEHRKNIPSHWKAA